MKRNLYRTVVLGLVALSLAGTPVLAQDSSKLPIKQLMSENFARVGKILTDLIAARYTETPKEADLIVQHANQLIASPPPSIKSDDDRAVFLTFATNLRLAATNLKDVTQVLASRDKEAAGSGELKVDYLRVAAASHYGNMVTACVLCHNQFRRRSL
jgi:hypothetical protein